MDLVIKLLKCFSCSFPLCISHIHLWNQKILPHYYIVSSVRSVQAHLCDGHHVEAIKHRTVSCKLAKFVLVIFVFLYNYFLLFVERSATIKKKEKAIKIHL